MDAEVMPKLVVADGVGLFDGLGEVLFKLDVVEGLAVNFEGFGLCVIFNTPELLFFAFVFKSQLIN